MRYFLFTTAFVVFMFSCTKVDTGTPNGAGQQDLCSAYDPEKITTWLPYELNKTYKYIDGGGSTYTLTVDSIFSSDEFYAPAGSCMIHGGVYALPNTNDPMAISMNVNYTATSDPLGPFLSIDFMEANVSIRSYGPGVETLKPNGGTDLSAIENMSFGGKDYNRVHEFTVNTDKLQKLYIAKRRGVVAFVTADGIEYWLQ